jgi:hypothetical protein
MDSERKKQTATAIHDFVVGIQRAVDEKKNLIGIFCDLSTAYDVLNHKILLLNLGFYGISCKSVV